MKSTDIDKMITAIRIKNLREADRNIIDDSLEKLQKALMKKKKEEEDNSIPKIGISTLKFRRLKLSLSLQNVKDETNISMATISRIERGGDALYKTIVTLDKLYKQNGV